MKVKITNLSTGSPAWTAKVSNGSVAEGSIELGGGGTFINHTIHRGPEEWIDRYGNQGFRYSIEEIEDPVSEPEPRFGKMTDSELLDAVLDGLNRFHNGVDGIREWTAKYCPDSVQYITGAEMSTSITHITRIKKLIEKEATPPSPLMQAIGNIKRVDWNKIATMANEDIQAQNTGPNGGVPPVNTAQAIRVVYAFERYVRESIKPEPQNKGQDMEGPE